MQIPSIAPWKDSNSLKWDPTKKIYTQSGTGEIWKKRVKIMQRYSDDRYCNVNGIVLHYTASPQTGRTDQIFSNLVTNHLNYRYGYNYMLMPDGTIYEVVNWRRTVWHAGGGANETTIGINFVCWGWLKNPRDPNSNTRLNWKGNVALTNGSNTLDRWAQLVDYKGNKIQTLRSTTYCGEVTDLQIQSCKNLLLWFRYNEPNHVNPVTGVASSSPDRSNGKGIPFYLEGWGQNVYNRIFPEINRTPTFDRNQAQNERWGKIWSHSAISKQRSDCMPTPKIVQMFKDLNDSGYLKKP